MNVQTVKDNAAPSLTWVGNRGDGDLVDGFACAEACDDVLDPPQLLPHLGFLVLLVEKGRGS